jgi:hypothetical protein
MMKSVQILPGIISLALCGTAAAHGISGDNWNDTGAVGAGTTVTVNPAALPEGISLAGIRSLSFSPGTASSSYEVLSQLIEPADQPTATADEWRWGGPPDEAVSLTATSLTGQSILSNAPELTVSFGYGDSPLPSQDCGNYAGQTASLTVNGNIYTAKNPCQLVSGTSDLVFVKGVLQAGTGVGWTLTSTTQAPELDSACAAGGLTLLLGSLLVLRGRRIDMRAGAPV